jgi:hypothetical protein
MICLIAFSVGFVLGSDKQVSLSEIRGRMRETSFLRVSERIAYVGYELPMNTPVKNTITPPTITCNTAMLNRVFM